MSLDAAQPETSDPGDARGPGSSALSFDARRWTGQERIAGAATLLLLISLWRPWFYFSLPGMWQYQRGDILTVHPWLWAVFALGLLVLALIVLQACFDNGVPFARPPGLQQLLAGATTANLLVVLLTVVLSYVSNPVGAGYPTTVHWRLGAFLALCSAAVAAGAGLSAVARLGEPPTDRRWTWAGGITGAASLVMLAALFLPWFLYVDLSYPDNGEVFRQGDILVVRPWLAVVVALAAGVLGTLIVRPHGARGLVAAATVANLLLVGLAIVLTVESLPLLHDATGLQQSAVTMQVQPGAMVALAAAAAAAIAGLRRALTPTQANL